MSATTSTQTNLATGIELQAKDESQQSTTYLRPSSTTHIIEPSPSEDNILATSQAYDNLVPDGGWDAWMVVVGCSIIAFWQIGSGYAWGIMQNALVSEKLSSPSTLAFVGSLTTCCIALMALAGARVVRWLGARGTALVGVLLVGLGQIASGFATKSVPGLFIGTGLVQGVGSSLCFLVLSVTPAQYFHQKRGLATGIVYSCGGLGGGVISFAMSGLLSRLSPAWTFRVLGILTLSTAVPAAYLVKERAPIRRRVLVEWQLFRDLNFVVLLLAGAVATFPLLVPPFFLPLYASSLGMSASTGAGLVAGFNFASAAGRVAIGFFCDRAGPLNALMLTLFVSALSMLCLWPFSHGVGPLAVFAVANGASNGGFFSSMPIVSSSVFGSARVSVVMGMLISGWAGGYLMGAPIAGYLLAAYGGEQAGFKAFRPAMYYAGSMAMGAGLLTAFVRFRINSALFTKV